MDGSSSPRSAFIQPAALMAREGLARFAGRPRARENGARYEREKRGTHNEDSSSRARGHGGSPSVIYHFHR
ncbi:unnamed protein product [Colias eurytheme]|nr:unnamed protein product [Colias eurytheme]